MPRQRPVHAERREGDAALAATLREEAAELEHGGDHGAQDEAQSEADQRARDQRFSERDTGAARGLDHFITSLGGGALELELELAGLELLEELRVVLLVDGVGTREL